MIKGIKNKDIKDFEKCCNKLKVIMDRITDYTPEANLYVASGDINLMCDCKRDGFGGSPSQDSIVTSFTIGCIDGGDW
jgi:hypothetical protein